MELGIDHNETRSRHERRRHVSLVMPAFAMMAAIRFTPTHPQQLRTAEYETTVRTAVDTVCVVGAAPLQIILQTVTPELPQP